MDTRPGSPLGTLKVPEAASRLGISADLAYDLIKTGQFPAATIRLGRRVVVVRSSLDRLLNGTNGADTHDD